MRDADGYSRSISATRSRAYVSCIARASRRSVGWPANARALPPPAPCCCAPVCFNRSTAIGATRLSNRLHYPLHRNFVVWAAPGGCAASQASLSPLSSEGNANDLALLASVEPRRLASGPRPRRLRVLAFRRRGNRTKSPVACKFLRRRSVQSAIHPAIQALSPLADAHCAAGSFRVSGRSVCACTTTATFARSSPPAHADASPRAIVSRLSVARMPFIGLMTDRYRFPCEMVDHRFRQACSSVRAAPMLASGPCYSRMNPARPANNAG